MRECLNYALTTPTDRFNFLPFVEFHVTKLLRDDKQQVIELMDHLVGTWDDEFIRMASSSGREHPEVVNDSDWKMFFRFQDKIHDRESTAAPTKTNAKGTKPKAGAISRGKGKKRKKPETTETTETWNGFTAKSIAPVMPRTTVQITLNL